MGYKNIVCRSGDGYKGWVERAPFDIIVVTAAADEIPKTLTDQLAENGRLIMPVGKSYSIQDLLLVTKKNGKLEQKNLAPVRFVPLIKKKE
jgi:protein-L-isoaspartate(D-aspartate) O-methyltransferase